jgi:hypothetical protein
MSCEPRLAELTATLEQLVPTVTALRDTMAAQRGALAADDLDRLLALIGEQEETSARLAHLERRRQRQQGDLEAAIGVEGLRAILDRGSATAAARAERMGLLDELGLRVAELQMEQERSAALLRSAIDSTRRARAYLTRLSGTPTTYGPSATAAPGPRLATVVGDGRP